MVQKHPRRAGVEFSVRKSQRARGSADIVRARRPQQKVATSPARWGVPSMSGAGGACCLRAGLVTNAIKPQQLSRVAPSWLASSIHAPLFYKHEARSPVVEQSSGVGTARSAKHNQATCLPGGATLDVPETEPYARQRKVAPSLLARLKKSATCARGSTLRRLNPKLFCLFFPTLDKQAYISENNA